MEWTTACPDWEHRILTGQSLVPCPPLFPDEAAAGLDIFKSLRIIDVAGKPEMGEVCRPWVTDFVAAIFGAYDPISARRLINEFFLLIAKKNTKSTTAAGIMVTALLRNWRHSAEYIILAPTLEIAKNSAEPAMDMVNEDPELRKLLKPVAHQRTIEHRTTGASLKIVAADSDVVGGKKATGILIDELWLFGKKANASAMFREATGGLASRPEGFVIALSTESDEPPAGVFLDWLKRFRKIRAGRLRAPRSLGVLYEFPKSMLDDGSFKDPANWWITNPNLGLSVDRQFLLDEYEKALEKGQKEVIGFFAKSLNIEVGQYIGSDAWAGAEYWEAAGDPAITLEYIIEWCELVTVGIDGGGLDDLLGLNVLGRHKVTRDWLAWGHCWAHQTVLKRRTDIASKIEDLVKLGQLTMVENVGDDVVEVADIVERIDVAGLLPEKNAIGVDQAGIAEIVDELTKPERGIAIERIVGVPQGWKLNNAILTAERRLASKTPGKRMRHSASAMMAWQVGNAKVELKGSARVITKQAAGYAKIDWLMSLYDSVVVMSLNPEPATSVFDQLADEDERARQSGVVQPQSNDIDMEILGNPRHPRWQEMRERYEARLAAQDTDQEFM